MNGREMYLLGRRLMKIAESAMPSGSRLPRGVALVLEDVYLHPDSSVGEITARTGFPQSHVSMAVARLRDAGAVETAVDPADHRRTLVRATARTAENVDRGMGVPVDRALAQALHTTDARVVAEIVDMLDSLADRLLPEVRASQPAQASGPARRPAGR